MADGDHPEFLLRAGDWRCTVSPFGASLRRLWLEPAGKPVRDVLWGYTGTANKAGGQGDVLAPFPGRIRAGKYTFDGKTHQLPTNDKEGPNAIHGFVRSRLWDGQQHDGTAHFRTRITAADHAGYPFDLDLAVGYELLPSGLASAFVVRNAGSVPAPFGAGFHPYIAAPDGVEGVDLQVPASRLVEFDGLLPTGAVDDIPLDLDFRRARPIGATRLNHCLTGLSRDALGFARVRADEVEVWMDGAFTHLVLYTGDSLGAKARKAVAIEPMTCATDAFNQPEWGLRVLAPGEVFAGTWGVRRAAS